MSWKVFDFPFFLKKVGKIFEMLKKQGKLLLCFNDFQLKFLLNEKNILTLSLKKCIIINVEKNSVFLNNIYVKKFTNKYVENSEKK